MRSRAFLLPFAAAVLLAGTQPQAQPRQEREAPAVPGQASEVGNGGRPGRQALRPGAYITPRYRKAVQAWLAKHHGPGKPCLPGLVKQGAGCGTADAGPGWQIGIPVPRSAKVHPLPAGLAAALPKAPPGNEYILLSGDILLIASASRIVVDAVPRAAR
ncbi:MAG: hypothetical protein ACO1PB_04350 [Ramlibacter sp.]